MRVPLASALAAIGVAAHAMVIDPVDPRFGIPVIEGPQARVHRVVPLRDGRLALLASSTQSGCTSPALVVYAASGVPDATFADAGVAYASRMGLPSCVDPVSLGAASDDKGALYVAARAAGPTQGMRIAKVLPSGVRDPAFDAIVLPGGESMRSPAVEILADGTIAVGGTATLRDAFGSAYSALVVVHLRADGAPDATYGMGGVASAVPANRPIYDRDGGGMAHHADGSVLIAGNIFEDDAGAKIYSDAAVARFDARGRLDTTYGDNGFAIPLRDASTVATALAVRNSEAWLAGVQGRDVPYAFVAKIRSNGAIDLAWGTAGIVGTDRFAGDGADPLVAVDAAARSYVSWRNASGHRQVTRYRADGAVDASFGLDGHAFVAAQDWRVDGPGALLASEAVWIVSAATRVDDPGRGAVVVAQLAANGGHRDDVAAGTAVIYYNAALDHFFLTTNPAEQALLDSGATPGWRRTGQGFRAVTNANAITELTPVCRYYGRPEAHLDSHFFSAAPDECAAVAVKFGASWLLETSAAFYVHPANRDSGGCPRGSERVFRAFDGRADANHYYGVVAAAPAGWTYEGYGAAPLPTAFCAPLL